MSTAFFAGSFNPFTIGHRDIVERALQIFDRVIIGVGVNSEKSTTPQPSPQWEGALKFVSETAPERVEVVAYTGLTAKAAREHGATVLLRSLRNAADLAYETPIAEANRREFGLDTVFLLARPELAHVSSSLVRELARHGHPIDHLLGTRQ